MSVPLVHDLIKLQALSILKPAVSWPWDTPAIQIDFHYFFFDKMAYKAGATFAAPAKLDCQATLTQVWSHLEQARLSKRAGCHHSPKERLLTVLDDDVDSSKSVTVDPLSYIRQGETLQHCLLRARERPSCPWTRKACWQLSLSDEKNNWRTAGASHRHSEDTCAEGDTTGVTWILLLVLMAANR